MNRYRIFERDDFCCAYCGDQFEPADLTVDHVEARARGGDHSDGNLVTACKACNTLKGRARLADFLRERPAARTIFFARATHVWPRILRVLREELDSPSQRGQDAEP